MSPLPPRTRSWPATLEGVTYAVTVDTAIPSGAPKMDELHRVGAIALLEDGFAAVESLEGPDEAQVDIADSWVGVHPDGAILKVFVDAPNIEAAEEAVRALVEELLERTELLAEWTVERCEVELHPEILQESLDSAEGPDAPPADVAARRAHLLGRSAAGTGSDPEHDAAEQKAVEGKMRAMSAQLRSFGPDMFGVLDEEEGDEFAAYGPGTAPEDAELAAGALVWASVVLLDELFQDVITLAKERTNVGESERVMWRLDDLPPRYALQYDLDFARCFLVTTTALTTRFTEGSFRDLSCVAEELALRLLLSGTEVTLETFGLLNEGVASALECFAESVYEDMDHEWLYDDSADGIDESEVGELLRIAPMALASWFKPFNDGRYVHPYAQDGDDAQQGEAD